MAQIIPGQWLNVESAGFDNLFGATTRGFEVFERLTALNLEAIRFGLAETQEAMARTCAADNLPELLCLPTLLAPVGVAQALSYSRQFFEILSDLQRDAVPAAIGTGRQRHPADGLVGGLATQALVPAEAVGKPQTSAAPAAPRADTAQNKKASAHRKPIPPMHTE